ncbi:hypothetical protein [Janthinobacterium sp. P210005]|uniref:hypothetical protein n=1 Tax=Janthinobacterium sp. P210005 TaxID=3112938 RepID=UPI002E264966|nr:hypothetical protein [Janthinobacterium sp. P210005]
MQGFNQDIPIARFFACVFFIALGFALLVAGLVFIVDPYAIWRHQSSHKINTIRLEIPNSSQTSAAVLRSTLNPPDVLILGSSRVRRGFNETLASSLYGGNVQVAGIDALPLSTARDLFFTLSQGARIRRLYLEVNYLTSNACETKNENAVTKNELDLPFHYLSPENAVIYSLRTLKINLFPPRSFDSYFDKQGRYYDDQAKGATRAGGAQAHESRFKQLFKTIASACQNHANNAADIRDLTAIFHLAQTRQIEVILLILPVSEKWQTRIRQAGLVPQAAQWKREVTLLASQFHVPLLDYELRNGESDHSDNVSPSMPMFWDETHFSNRLGDQLLRAMLDASGRSSIRPKIP